MRYERVPHCRLSATVSGLVQSDLLHFRSPRHRMTAASHRTERAERFQIWNQATELNVAA